MSAFLLRLPEGSPAGPCPSQLPPDFNPYIVEPDFWSAFDDDDPPPEPDEDDFDIEPNYDEPTWPETD
jgi:hypothetical protein